VIEVAVAYVGAYLARKALRLAKRAGADADSAIDSKLDQLYDWVKGKLTGTASGPVSLSLLEDAPEGDKQQKLVTQQLTEAVGADEAARGELEELVAELDRLRPQGVSIKGLARAEDVYGEQVGADVKGPLAPGDSVEGEAITTTLHEGGTNIGTRYEPGK
jgi:hypothetical protein